ncbi:hypothetical protein Tco_0478905 [Tanacetum coccineum]
MDVKELASPKQTALGKDISNPLIVDSLLKTIWLSMHHVIAMKHWLFQSKQLLEGSSEMVVMTRNYFLQYTQLEILEFHDTLIQHMESVKKSIDERALHKREYDIRVNERQIQTTEGKVDTGKAVDASLVNTESIGTESKEQDTSNRSGNDAHADAN